MSILDMTAVLGLLFTGGLFLLALLTYISKDKK